MNSAFQLQIPRWTENGVQWLYSQVLRNQPLQQGLQLPQTMKTTKKTADSLWNI